MNYFEQLIISEIGCLNSNSGCVINDYMIANNTALGFFNIII